MKTTSFRPVCNLSGEPQVIVRRLIFNGGWDACVSPERNSLSPNHAVWRAPTCVPLSQTDRQWTHIVTSTKHNIRRHYEVRIIYWCSLATAWIASGVARPRGTNALTTRSSANVTPTRRRRFLYVSQCIMDSRVLLLARLVCPLEIAGSGSEK